RQRRCCHGWPRPASRARTIACARSATHSLAKIDETLLATVFVATFSRPARGRRDRPGQPRALLAGVAVVPALCLAVDRTSRALRADGRAGVLRTGRAGQRRAAGAR